MAYLRFDKFYGEAEKLNAKLLYLWREKERSVTGTRAVELQNWLIVQHVEGAAI